MKGPNQWRHHRTLLRSACQVTERRSEQSACMYGAALDRSGCIGCGGCGSSLPSLVSSRFFRLPHVLPDHGNHAPELLPEPRCTCRLPGRVAASGMAVSKPAAAAAVAGSARRRVDAGTAAAATASPVQGQHAAVKRPSKSWAAINCSSRSAGHEAKVSGRSSQSKSAPSDRICREGGRLPGSRLLTPPSPSRSVHSDGGSECGGIALSKRVAPVAPAPAAGCRQRTQRPATGSTFPSRCAATAARRALSRPPGCHRSWQVQLLRAVGQQGRGWMLPLSPGNVSTRSEDGNTRGGRDARADRARVG